MKARKAISLRAVWVLTCLLFLGILAVSAEAQQPFKLRVGAIAKGDFAGGTVGPGAAFKEGYFKDEGIDAVFSYHVSGPAVLQAMAAGDVDTTISTAIVPFFQAVGAGVDLVWVGSTIKDIAHFVVRPEIKSVKELDGKRVGTPGIGTIQDTLLTVFERQQGIRTIHVYGRITDLLTYLEKGEVVGVVSWQPIAELARRRIGATYVAKSVMPGSEGVGIVFPRAFIERHPDVVKRFLKANLRGLQYFQKNRDAYVEWLAKRENLELDVVRSILFDPEMVRFENPLTDWPSTKILIRAARDAGKIPKEKIADDAAIDAWMAKHIDESFLQAAIREIGWKGGSK